jgi:hypothetical protein
MKPLSIVINIFVLLIYVCSFGQDSVSTNNKSSKEVQFKKLNAAQQKYLNWTDKKNREFPFGVPAVAYNKYDGVMFGAAIVNLKQPVKNVDFTASLLYGIKSKKVNGTVNIDYYYKPKKSIVSLVKPGIKFQSFTQDNFIKPLKYYALHPEIAVTLNHRTEKLEKLEHQLIFINHTILQKKITYDYANSSYDKDTITRYYVNEFKYTFKRNDNNFPLSASLSIEQSAKFAKLNFEAHSFIRYQLKDYNTGVHFRLFVGGFLWRKIKKPNAGYSLAGFNYNLTGTTGPNNYKYDDFFVTRNESDGFGANQISANDGFLKMTTPLQSPNVGQSGNFIFAFNTKIDFPIKYVPIKLFFDLGYMSDKIVNPNTPPALNQFAYDLGLMFSFFDEGFEIYLPFLYSKEYKSYYASNNIKFGQRITFLLDLHKLELHKKIRDMKF